MTRIEVKSASACSIKWLKDNHFTDDAIAILRDAKERAMARPVLGTVSPVIVLWSILRWERKLAQVVLRRILRDTTQLEYEIDGLLSASVSLSPPPVIDLSQIGVVARMALEVSTCYESHYVGSEHLLLALTRCDDVLTTQLLDKYGVTVSRIREILGEEADPDGLDC